MYIVVYYKMFLYFCNRITKRITKYFCKDKENNCKIQIKWKKILIMIFGHRSRSSRTKERRTS